MDFEALKDHMIQRLKSQLPKDLYYHSAKHTEYVLSKAEFIAEKEKISNKKKSILRIAALYHDSGFLINAKNHEYHSCEIAKNELIPKGYNLKEVEEICELIMATKLPQSPKSDAARVLADADLFYLGTNNFEEIGNLLFKEMMHFNLLKSETDWYKTQIDFLNNHRFHTYYCQQKLEDTKQLNLRKVERKLALI